MRCIGVGECSGKGLRSTGLLLPLNLHITGSVSMVYLPDSAIWNAAGSREKLKLRSSTRRGGAVDLTLKTLLAGKTKFGGCLGSRLKRP